jgi:hypothetical protein
MKVFVTGRQMGKTQKCIEWAAANDAYIVTHSKKEADRIFQHAEKQGIKIRLPITYDELLGGRLAGTPQALVYDNVDMLLVQLARGRRVVGWTATTLDYSEE